MIKVSLPDGTHVEGDTPKEVAEMLDLLGMSPRKVAVQAPAATLPVELAAARRVLRLRSEAGGTRPPHWTPVNAGEFLHSLPAPTRRLLLCLIEPDLSAAPTSVLARQLGLPDPKPIGSMLASIRRRAEQMGLPCPVTSEVGEDQTVRVVRLELPFRDAARRHFTGAE